MKKILLALTLLTAVTAQAQQQGLIPKKFGQSYGDNAPVRFGNSLDSAVEFDTNQTVDALLFGLSSPANYIAFVEKADMEFNFAHAAQSNPTLYVHSRNQNANQWISVAHDGTNGIINVGTGAVTFPGGVSASFTPTGMMTFSSGAAVTATSYQVGRNADGTNQLHFNVPTGAGFEFSVNDVAEATLNASTADFKDNTITTSGSITSTAATNIGWSVVAGANTACNTTCTNACVFGQNTADMTIVDCASAVADVCVCAGAN